MPQLAKEADVVAALGAPTPASDIAEKAHQVALSTLAEDLTPQGIFGS